MVGMFGGGVVLILDGNFILFLPWETYGAGVFCSCLNPNRGKVANVMVEADSHLNHCFPHPY
jgi:hypothetical protein